MRRRRSCRASPTSASVARPSWPSRSTCRASDLAPGRRTEIRRRRQRDCRELAREKATLLVERERERRGRRAASGTDGSVGLTPTSSATRAAAVRTSVRAGDTGSSPAIASRGRPRPEVVEDDDGDGSTRERRLVHEARGTRAAERSRVGRDEHEGAFGTGSGPSSCGANPRASSMSVAVPDAFSPSGCFGARVVTMRNDDDRLVRAPGHDRHDVAELDAAEVREILRSRRPPRSGGRAIAMVSRYQRAASSAPSEPGTRDGYSTASVSANDAADSASKSGSSGDRGSALVVEIENRSASNAGTTTRKPTRTRRALRGRSTVPRRSRRPRVRGRAASIAGL